MRGACGGDQVAHVDVKEEYELYQISGMGLTAFAEDVEGGAGGGSGRCVPCTFPAFSSITISDWNRRQLSRIAGRAGISKARWMCRECAKLFELMGTGGKWISAALRTPNARARHHSTLLYQIIQEDW